MGQSLVCQLFCLQGLYSVTSSPNPTLLISLPPLIAPWSRRTVVPSVLVTSLTSQQGNPHSVSTLTEAIPAVSFQFWEGESPTTGLDRHFSSSVPNKCGAVLPNPQWGLFLVLRLCLEKTVLPASSSLMNLLSVSGC